MSFYLKLEAINPIEAELLNQEFMERFSNQRMFLWSHDRIQEQLFAPGESLGSIQAWGQKYPHMRAGKGLWKVDQSELADGAFRDLQQQIKWIIQNRDRFLIIDGIGQLAEMVEVFWDGDFIVAGKTGEYSWVSEVSFNTMPSPKGDVLYESCLTMNEPYLWAAICKARAELNHFNWYVLSQMTLPWSGKTVEQTLLANRGRFHGIHGIEFDNLPNRFELEKALRTL